MELFGQTVSTGSGIFLLLALAMALSFEFVNGFHDTANAVATVIYTHSLKPTVAVVWSGCWNLIGVLVSSGAIAYGVLALLPVELVLNVGSGAGFAMVFALLLSAILWNLSTWYLGLPASSSHTLIGAIMGVGLANSWLANAHEFGEGINWTKAREVGTTLLVSPIVGFVAAAGLLLLYKLLIRRKDLYMAPDKDKAPPLWIRGLLILTCTGVGFGHGSNDGQKGMGLIMLILVGILPLSFAVDLSTSPDQIKELAATTETISFQMDRHSPGVAMGGFEIAKDELSAYLKTTGKINDRTFAAVGT
jgi:inorganic phosphate transporter, PiT family